MAKTATFTLDSGVRVGLATQRVERMGRGVGVRENVGANRAIAVDFPETFPARIVSAALAGDGSNHTVWKYTIKLGSYSAPSTAGGLPVWNDESGETTYIAYSDSEIKNGSGGAVVIGQGVHVDTATGLVSGTSCVLMPLAAGCIVRGRVEGWYSDGTPMICFAGISNSAEAPGEE